MSQDSHREHPYQQFERTRQWAVLDRAVMDLVSNDDLQETTAHEYVVGYLCRALADDLAVSPPDAGVNATPEVKAREVRPKRSREEVLAIFGNAREAVQMANPNNRDILEEFLSERRAAAERE